MRKQICKKEYCTGCGACKTICPKNCIEFRTNSLGTLYPYINGDICSNCNQCIRVCPNNSEKDYKMPMATYAAWTSDKKRFNQAASGGVASELYLFALKNNVFTMGTCFHRKTGVTFETVKNEKDIEWARGSKYVYSDMQPCFDAYFEKLKKKEHCLFIGLPCQVAAIKSFCREKNLNEDYLVTTELICHGVPNFEYFDKHLIEIEKQKKKNISNVSFRDSKKIYFFKAVSDSGKIIYRQGMHEGDLYYRAFALNLNFRENCYHCIYAKKERISDLTIGDFSGLGRIMEFPFKTQKISVVLVNSEKGWNFIKSIEKSKKLILIERPFEEAYQAKGNVNLRHPSIPYKTRSRFVKEYLKKRDYDIAAYEALKEEIRDWNRKKIFVRSYAFLMMLIPRTCKDIVKHILFKHFIL